MNAPIPTHPTHNPVFSSVNQALHVSYLFEILPATQKGVMQAAYERNVKRDATEWEDVAMREKTLDFSGLSALEVRGQCALVLAAVQSKCTESERHALEAYYGHQITKTRGVRGLESILSLGMDHLSSAALLACLWAEFCDDKHRVALNSHAIAKEYCLTVYMVDKARENIRKHAKKLIHRAHGALDGYFRATGLVGEVVV